VYALLERSAHGLLEMDLAGDYVSSGLRFACAWLAGGLWLYSLSSMLVFQDGVVWVPALVVRLLYGPDPRIALPALFDRIRRYWILRRDANATALRWILVVGAFGPGLAILAGAWYGLLQW